jgi:hypothetical protein
MGIQSYIKWIETNLPEDCTIGYDPKLFSITEIETYIKRFENHDIKLKSISDNLVDKIWSKIPSQKQAIISDHKIEYSGIKRAEKLNKLRNTFIKSQDEALFVGDANFISSFTNLRAYRNEYTPAIPALCVITTNNCHLFVENCRINKNDVTKIAKDIKIHDLKDFKRDITNILKNVKVVKLDKSVTTIFVQEIFKKLNIKVLHQNDINHSKAIKNSIELEAFKKAHELDAIAICNFLHWIKKQKN